jgi:hypothetical protein
MRLSCIDHQWHLGVNAIGALNKRIDAADASIRTKFAIPCQPPGGYRGTADYQTISYEGTPLNRHATVSLRPDFTRKQCHTRLGPR